MCMFTLTTHMLFAKPQRVSQLALPKQKKNKKKRTNKQKITKTKNHQNSKVKFKLSLF